MLFYTLSSATFIALCKANNSLEYEIRKITTMAGFSADPFSHNGRSSLCRPSLIHFAKFSDRSGLLFIEHNQLGGNLGSELCNFSSKKNHKYLHGHVCWSTVLLKACSAKRVAGYDSKRLRIITQQRLQYLSEQPEGQFQPRHPNVVRQRHSEPVATFDFSKRRSIRVYGSGTFSISLTFQG